MGVAIGAAVAVLAGLGAVVPTTENMQNDLLRLADRKAFFYWRGNRT